MNLTYFDTKKITKRVLDTERKKLDAYRSYIDDVIVKGDETTPEYSLAQAFDEVMLQSVYEAVSSFKKPKHVVLVGIGGSSLGVEAVHSVVATTAHPRLHVLDTVAAHELESVMNELRTLKKASDIAVCVVSKSGKTTETLANAELLLGLLSAQVGQEIYAQTICIGDPKSPLKQIARKLGATYVPMAPVVGGRFSVFTPVGLVPLLLLGHDIESFLSGAVDAVGDAYEEVAAENAVRMVQYLGAGYSHYNLFMFDTRLVRLGKWCRQLMAESLGKAELQNGKKNHSLAFHPTVTTPVELHSVGQLYFSGILPVYTDFISFDDNDCDFEIPAKSKFTPALSRKSLQEIATAMYAGVVSAYQERKLPYRATLFGEDRLHSLGLFMAMRMRETMYIATLLELNAFDQPNVELYKKYTSAILNVKKK